MLTVLRPKGSERFYELGSNKRVIAVDLFLITIGMNQQARSLLVAVHNISLEFIAPLFVFGYYS